MIDACGLQIAGKEAVVVGRSNIVGKPVAKLLLDRQATVTIAHSKTRDLADVTSRADILISAVGVPRLITAKHVKRGAVVRAGADVRQAGCEVHPLVHSQHLKRDKTLVVVHGQYRIEAAVSKLTEKAIRGEGTEYGQPLVC